MDTRDRILSYIHTHGPSTSTSLSRYLKISRQSVHRYLRELLNQGKIVRTGQTKGARYFLRAQGGLHQIARQRFQPPFPPEHEVYKTDVEKLTQSLPRHVADIIHYTFTELFNNAIEHAQASFIEITLEEDGRMFAFTIRDDGVGCFENIRAKRKLNDLRESIEELSKGKLTTAPKNHTGEGIFFSSKAATQFTLESNDLKWIVDNARKDVSITNSEITKGSLVRVIADKQTNTTMEKIFREYTGEDYEFDKTRIYIRLFERGEVFVSRSEAKRLLAGLDRFREIILDFSNVRLIGQSFADEIFRVYQNAHPDIRMTMVNASEDILFMIERSKRTGMN